MKHFLGLVVLALLALAPPCNATSMEANSRKHKRHKKHPQHKNHHHHHHKGKHGHHNHSNPVGQNPSSSNDAVAPVHNHTQSAAVHLVVNSSSKDKSHPSSVRSVEKINTTDAKPAVVSAMATEKTKALDAASQEERIVRKIKQLEAELTHKPIEGGRQSQSAAAQATGRLNVNGPVPLDFAERFAQAVGHATGSDPHQVKVTGVSPAATSEGVLQLTFQASKWVVEDTEDQAADPNSRLAHGPMRVFLMADDADVSAGSGVSPEDMEEDSLHPPVRESGIDVDTAMPYGELEPFGREDTAQELTEQSIKESDEMVDQLERAEVAEEKRAVFRALTRLRGAAITSFDGVARAQTSNIDEYNKIHKWRRTHPLHHLADEESDISRWAFPVDADF